MTTSPTSTTIDPRALASDQREALIDALYATHTEIFSGLTRAQFAAYVVDSPADRTRIEVYRSEGRVVGYLALHTFVREIAGERWVVLRGETGKLPGFRRAARGVLMIREVSRVCLRYPGAHKALLGCFVHPSPYLALAHVVRELYPHWSRPTPAPVLVALDQLAAEFGLARVEGRPSGVRKVGWITRESEQERASWARRSDAPTRFFTGMNPGYGDGEGLLILAPISVANFVSGTLRHLRREYRRRSARLGRGVADLGASVCEGSR